MNKMIYQLVENNLNLQINIDINNRDIIENIEFKTNMDKWKAFFESYIKNIRGIPVDQVPKINHMKQIAFINPMNILINKAIQHFKGEIIEAPCDTDNLVCRCFKVDEHQIRKEQKNNPTINAIEITSKLKAGGGCTSCIEDIENLLKSTIRLKSPYNSPVKVILKADKLVKNYFDKSFKELEIIKYKDNTLYFRNNLKVNKDKLPALKNYLSDKLFIDIDINFY